LQNNNKPLNSGINPTENKKNYSEKKMPYLKIVSGLDSDQKSSSRKENEFNEEVVGIISLFSDNNINKFKNRNSEINAISSSPFKPIPKMNSSNLIVGNKNPDTKCKLKTYKTHNIILKPNINFSFL